jgi:hypothetical protein
VQASRPGVLRRALATGLAAALAAQASGVGAQGGATPASAATPSTPAARPSSPAAVPSASTAVPPAAAATPSAPAAGPAVLSVPELPARRDRPAAPGTAPAPAPADAGHLQRDAQRRLLDPPLSTGLPQADRGAIDPAQAEALRRQGEREGEARRLRGGLSPVPEPTPRIEVAPMPAMPPPPRVELPPAAGQPGGPPIALPTCGPAGCFDANGRPLGGGAGGVLITPEGRPCIRVGGQAGC